MYYYARSWSFAESLDYLIITVGPLRHVMVCNTLIRTSNQAKQQELHIKSISRPPTPHSTVHNDDISIQPQSLSSTTMATCWHIIHGFIVGTIIIFHVVEIIGDGSTTTTTTSFFVDRCDWWRCIRNVRIDPSGRTLEGTSQIH